MALINEGPQNAMLLLPYIPWELTGHAIGLARRTGDAAELELRVWFRRALQEPVWLEGAGLLDDGGRILLE